VEAMRHLNKWGDVVELELLTDEKLKEWLPHLTIDERRDTLEKYKYYNKKATDYFYSEGYARRSGWIK
jgi:hypothetical protein